MITTRLSPCHKLFYYEYLLNPKSTHYNMVVDQDFKGVIDVERLDKAIQSFVSNYVLFNSHVINVNEELYWEFNSAVKSLDYFDEPLSDNELLDYVITPFNLNTGPLYRFALIKRATNCYRFIYIQHHILVDGLSSNFLFGEVANFYNIKNHKSLISKATQIQKNDELARSLGLIIDAHQDKHRQFWTQKLMGVEPVDTRFLKLKDTSRAEKYNQIELATNVSEIRFSFDESIYDKVNRVKKLYVVTPYMYSKNIFVLLLYRYTSQVKIGISYPVNIKEGINFIYGAHVNTNIIPYDFSKINTVVDLFLQSRDFFKSLKEDAPINGVEGFPIRSSINHSYYPIWKISEQAFDKQLLNLSFAQTSLKDSQYNFNDTIITKINSDFNIDLFGDLEFEYEANSINKKIFFRVKYANNVISKDLLEKFIENYKRLYLEILDEIITKWLVNTPLTNIHDYKLLTHDEYTKYIIKYNNTEHKYPHKKTLQKLFEEQVKQYPNHIALIYQDIKLTYQELNYRANQLAYYLINNYSIMPDDLIMLCLNRSELMLIAILGILKSGGAYVPVDPSSSVDSIAYKLKDTKAKLVITNQINKEIVQQAFVLIKKNPRKLLASYVINQILLLDDQEINLKLGKFPQVNPKTKCSSTNLAYVIYTSGTTGNPKGVLIEHHGVSNLATDLITRYQFTDNEVILGLSNYVFDASVEQITLALLSGNTLLLVPQDLWFDQVEFINYAITNKVTHIDATPQILEQYNFTQITSLKRIISGGDILTPALLAKLQNGAHYAVINEYGPTEATVIMLTNLNNTTLGRPINNMRIYVLDTHLHPLPIGAIGELYIAGVGLSRGYLNNSDLTIKKFIPNSFQTASEKRLNNYNFLYKTGDLVRFLPNGELAYIGRNDFQVKIRGFRIELAEIEFRLNTFKGIKQSLVIVVEDNESDLLNKHLVAYYVANSQLNEEDILSFLSTYLPEYMLPSFFVYLDHLPLNLSGKIDRKALPKIEYTVTNNYMPPTTLMEQQLCNIYSQVLMIDPTLISINSDFFKLGGNSILAIRLMNEISQNMKRKITITDVYTHNTIEKLAKQLLYSHDYTIGFKLNSAVDKPYLFMVHPGHAGCEVYFDLANRLTETYACYGIDSYNLYNEPKITNLNEIANYYLNYIEKTIKTAMVQCDSYSILGWSLGGQIALEIAAILEQRYPKIKIKLFLLDTFIHDNYSIGLINNGLEDEFNQNLVNYLTQNNYDDLYIQKIMDNSNIELNLIKQKLSSKLTTTEVTLFKAMQVNPIMLSQSQFNNYVISRNYNNLDLIHDNLTEVTIINLNTDHFNIVKDYNLFLDSFTSA